jgi:hypothetical protein
VLLQVLRDPQEHRQVDRSCSLHDTLASNVHSGSAERFACTRLGYSVEPARRVKRF